MKVSNRLTWFFVVSVLILGLTATSNADEKARLFLDGISLYNQGNYSTAAVKFESVAAMGIVNGELFYNIGNSYFKSGDMGRAILWYERALKLSPGDPDLNFNYHYAKEFVQDKQEEKVSPVVKVLFFWKHYMGKKAVQWAGIILFAVFWLIAVVQMIRGKKIFKIYSAVFFLVSLIFILTAIYDYYDDTYHRYAIIVSDKVSIRSGLTDDSTELFVLHVGSKVRIEKERRDYLKIRFSDGKIGWMKKSEAEII